MIAGGTLSRYLGRQFALWFVVFFLGLTGIIYMFEIAELLRRSADFAQATTPLILRMGFYKLPDTIEKILPFVVLFAGMFTFWRLTRSQELIIARAAGVSVWQFLAPALVVALFFGLFYIALANPIGTALNARYKELESRYLSGRTALELTGAGLWLRQEDGERHYLLHADRATASKPLVLTPLIVFVYGPDNGYLGRIDAQSATLQSGRWEIKDAWFNWDELPATFEANYTLPTTLTLDKIQESMAAPNTISFWELPAFIRALHAIGLPSVRHELQMQSLLAQPLLLCAMVFFAAAFSLRLTRRGGILNAMMAGMFVGSVVYSLNNVVTALGANQTLPVIVAAWAIPLAALVAGQATLLYLEDG